MPNPIVILLACIAIAGSAFALVLFRLDPHSGIGAPISFFTTMLLFLAGLCTLLVFGIRLWFSRNELYHQSLRRAFREGLLIAASVTALLALQAYRVLTWWAALIVAIVAVLVELTFFAQLDPAGDRPAPHRPSPRSRLRR